MNHRQTFHRLGCVFAALGLAALRIAQAESVAITFDDLPLNGVLPVNVTETDIAKDVLAILKKQRVPQVYGFINAKKLEGNPNGVTALKLWMAAGHRVGNHGYSHVNLHASPADAFVRDIEQNEPALQLLTADDEWRWMRYPYLREGDTLEKRRAVRTYLAEHGYRIAQVTLDYEDYLWNSPYARCVDKRDTNAIRWLRSTYLQTASDYLDANREMSKLVFGREISHVLLLHLGAFSSTILPDLFDMLKAKGFRIVTLDEAQRDSAYRVDPDAASRHGGTLLEQLMDARRIQYPKVSGKPQKELDALCR